MSHLRFIEVAHKTIALGFLGGQIKCRGVDVVLLAQALLDLSLKESRAGPELLISWHCADWE